MTSGIYQILNTTNGRIYVGSSIGFDKRWRTHRKELRGNRHHSQYLQHAWNKYGESSFVFQILEVVEDKERLLEREQHYMDMLHPAYNVRPTAGSNLGYRFSAEAKARLSAARKGKKKPPFTAQHKEKLRFVNLGRTASEETRRKMSLARAGAKRTPTSEITKKRIGDAQRGVKRVPLSDGHKEKIRASKIGIPRDAATRLKLARTKSKLDEVTIREIRLRVSSGEAQKTVALSLSISKQSVCKIVNKQQYAWVE